MSIKFNIIEKKIFDRSLENMHSFLELDIENLAKDSKVIEKVEKLSENLFNIETKNKVVLKKDLSLKSLLIYKMNKQKGMLHIKTMDSPENNLFLDCKIRAIPEKESTLIAVKLEAEVDFGYSSLINKGIKHFADREIKKFLDETLNSLEVNAA